MAYCWIWAFRRLSSIGPSEDSVFYRMGHWICVWIQQPESQRQIGLTVLVSKQIAKVLKEYGEERFAKRMAKALVLKELSGLSQVIFSS